MEIHFESVDPLLLVKHCRKKTKHPNFIRLPDLCLDKMPDGWKNGGFLEYVKWEARRTVKLIVGHKSSDRRGKFDMPGKSRIGTGYIANISDTNQTSVSDMSLTPDPGMTSPTTTKYGEDIELEIVTAAHVVYDLSEILKTKIELLFNNDDDRSSVILAEGVRLVKTNTEFDITHFIARVTRPEDKQKVVDIFSDRKCSFPITGKNLTFTISHPHGVAKRVTFGTPGEIRNIDYVSDGAVRRMYKLICLSESVLNMKGEKLLFYDIYNSIYRFVTKLPKYKLSPVEITRQTMIYLVNKGMVHCPNKQELTKLHQYFMKHIEVETETFKQMSRDIEFISRKYRDTKDTELHRPHGNVDLTCKEKFVQFYRELWREWRYKFREVRDGKYLADSYAGDVTTNYFLDTCPGSSGSRCFTIITEGTDKPVIHTVPHSIGRVGDSGISGGGATHYSL